MKNQIHLTSSKKITPFCVYCILNGRIGKIYTSTHHNNSHTYENVLSKGFEKVGRLDFEVWLISRLGERGREDKDHKV